MNPDEQKQGLEIPPPDGRPEHEQKFIAFPDNPDMYGHMDPFQKAPPKPNEYRDFAPPGQFPGIGNPRDPIHGVDGRGSLIVGAPQKPRAGKQIGDYEEMVGLGILPPGPGMRGPPGFGPMGSGMRGPPGFGDGFGGRRSGPGFGGPGFGGFGGF